MPQAPNDIFRKLGSRYGIWFTFFKIMFIDQYFLNRKKEKIRKSQIAMYLKLKLIFYKNNAKPPILPQN